MPGHTNSQSGNAKGPEQRVSDALTLALELQRLQSDIYLFDVVADAEFANLLRLDLKRVRAKAGLFQVGVLILSGQDTKSTLIVLNLTDFLDNFVSKIERIKA